MKEYKIKKFCGKPDWSTIPSLSIDVPYENTPDTITAGAQICYNDEAIYVHLSTVEEEIRAVEKGPLGMPCEDSCLEFFFSPMDDDIRYFNFEFNANGCLFLGLGKSLTELVRLVPDEQKNIFEPKISMTKDGWEIYYKVPYTFIRHFFPNFEIKPGKKVRANCYKCSDLSNPPHYLAWSAVPAQEELSFHMPEYFGIMEFTD